MYACVCACVCVCMRVHVCVRAEFLRQSERASDQASKRASERERMFFCTCVCDRAGLLHVQNACTWCVRVYMRVQRLMFCPLFLRLKDQIPCVRESQRKRETWSFAC